MNNKEIRAEINNRLRLLIIKRLLCIRNTDDLQTILNVVENPKAARPIQEIKEGEMPKGSFPVYVGFGRVYSCGQWAFISGIHRNTFRRYLKKGMTVEEIFEYRHCNPPAWTEQAE